ncbi:MAG: hypothetical protein NCW75_08215 [Phycisphaera sp.]|nr:MAG: hypothetical protein NCW75_08215 [Phycisphaera sp.]
MASRNPIIEDERGRRVQVVERLHKLPMWPWKRGRVKVGAATERLQRSYTIACVVCLLVAFAFMWMWDHAVMKKHGVPFTAVLMTALVPAWTIGVLAFLALATPGAADEREDHRVRGRVPRVRDRHRRGDCRGRRVHDLPQVLFGLEGGRAGGVPAVRV